MQESVTDKNKDVKDVLIEAEWKNLLHITYKTEQKHFLKIIPPGLEVDKYHGNVLISLIAFEFSNIKVKDIAVPLIGSFPEVNLRYYVTDGKRNGMVFIKEFVPQAVVGISANVLYNENYKVVPMNMDTNITNDFIKVVHTFTVGKADYSVSALAKKKTITPQDNTVEHFIKQKRWGFGKSPDGDRIAYKVDHSIWELYPLAEVKQNIDFGKAFGEEWSFLDNEEPYNVFLAKGSLVRIHGFNVEK